MNASDFFGGIVAKGIDSLFSGIRNFGVDMRTRGFKSSSDYMKGTTSDWNNQGYVNRYQAQFAQEQFDYQKALQNQIFDREDTTLQRSVQDARDAGLSPLAAVSGSSGAGSVVPVSDAGSQSGSDPAQSQASMLQMMSMMQQLRTGQAQASLLSKQAEAQDLNNAFQRAYNDYFESHHMLPPTEDKTLSALMQFLSGFSGQEVTASSAGALARSGLGQLYGAMSGNASGSALPPGSSVNSATGIVTRSDSGNSTAPNANYSFNRPFDFSRDVYSVVDNDSLTSVQKAPELYELFTGSRTYGNSTIAGYFIDGDKIHFQVQTAHGKTTVAVYNMPRRLR